MIHLLIKPFIKSSALANFLSYISVRTFISLFLSISIWLLFGEKFIQILKRFQRSGSNIRDLGQADREQKSKTPTAGGVFILFTLLTNVALWCDLYNPYILLLIFVALTHGAIGLADDYLKIKRKNYNGVRPLYKLCTQLIISAITYGILTLVAPAGVESSINMPFVKESMINLGCLYPLFVFVVISGSSNAVNLSDGMDGLAVGPIIITAACMSILCYVSGHTGFAKYLYMTYIPGSGELVVFCGALIGSCVGFLWYNAHPALLFMGDTGSLSIGAILGVISLVIKQEVIFALISFVFVWEAISVIIQVVYFRQSNKRIFLMAPFHHHLEKKGWSETQIVVRSWIASFLFALVGLACIKLR